ncbi:MAG: hypothetical protein EXR71_14695 [Myxococcales bacterium]|nr:hypothetical protein [Myxococcales bacterium]
MLWRWSVFFAFVLVFVAVGACVPAAPHAEAAAKPNVIVVLVDTLRADHLGPYAYKKRPTTPNLDAFAAGGVVWENAVSPNAWTVPSVASLFTGVDPQAHQCLHFRKGERLATDSISDAHDTMAESFAANGYATAAFIKSTVLSTSHGFSQGFARFEVVGGKDQAWGYSARDLNDAALPWLTGQQKAGTPFYAYLHFMDPHSPYKAPEPWYSKYKGTYTGKLDGAHVGLDEAFKAKTVSATDWEYMLALYDAEIEYWDTEFGRFWAELQAAGVAKNTIVVLVSDHGEAFGEHQNVFHGNLYQENIHIPVVFRGPGIKPGRMRGYAQLIDVVPTLAELTASPKGRAWQGKSMVAAMAGGAGHTAAVYSEYMGHRMAIEPSTGLKLIIGDGDPKLYDLRNDPQERTNLHAARPADADRIKTQLQARFSSGQALSKQFGVGKSEAMSAEQCEMLKALGYVEADKPCGEIKNDDDGHQN